MHVEVPTVTCWACSVIIGVPFLNETPAEAFKCGWCGAINKLSQQQSAPQHHPPTIAERSGPWQTNDRVPSQRQPFWQHVWLRTPREQPPHPALQYQGLDQQCSKHQVPEQYCFVADSQHQLQQCDQECPVSGQPPAQNELQQHTEQQTQHDILQQVYQQPQLWQLHIENPQDGPQQIQCQQQHQQQNSAHHQRQAPASRTPRHSSRLATSLKYCKQCASQLRWAVIALVLMIIGSVAGTGTMIVLPRLCTTQVTYLSNISVAAVLLAYIVFYYAASVLQSPGAVADWVVQPPRGPQGEVLQDSYEHYTWCEWCCAPKPPVAHHCRTCKMCVVDMDHHCPFINNCVGRGNLQPFLLFLVWTLLAAFYILGMCSMLVYEQWDVVQSSLRDSSSSGSRYVMPVDRNNSNSMQQLDHDAKFDSRRGGVKRNVNSRSSGLLSGPAQAATAAETRAGEAGGQGFAGRNWLLAATGFAVVLIQYAPGWLLATYYLIAAAIGIILALGMLLWSQLSYMARGVTYVGQLKSGRSRGVVQHQRLPQLQQADANDSWFGQAGQTQQGASNFSAPSRLSVLQCRLRDVLGISSCDSCWGVLRVLVVPRWGNPGGDGRVAAVKKWS